MHHPCLLLQAPGRTPSPLVLGLALLQVPLSSILYQDGDSCQQVLFPTLATKPLPSQEGLEEPV